jgi:hypothetical protein
MTFFLFVTACQSKQPHPFFDTSSALTTMDFSDPSMLEHPHHIFSLYTVKALGRTWLGLFDFKDDFDLDESSRASTTESEEEVLDDDNMWHDIVRWYITTAYSPPVFDPPELAIFFVTASPTAGFVCGTITNSPYHYSFASGVLEISMFPVRGNVLFRRNEYNQEQFRVVDRYRETMRQYQHLMDTYEFLSDIAFQRLSEDDNMVVDLAPPELTQFSVHFREFSGQMLPTRASATVGLSTYSQVFIANAVRSWPNRELWMAEQNHRLMKKCMIKWSVMAAKKQLMRKSFVDWCVATSPIRFLEFSGPRLPVEEGRVMELMGKRARASNGGDAGGEDHLKSLRETIGTALLRLQADHVQGASPAITMVVNEMVTITADLNRGEVNVALQKFAQLNRGQIDAMLKSLVSLGNNTTAKHKEFAKHYFADHYTRLEELKTQMEYAEDMLLKMAELISFTGLSEDGGRNMSWTNAQTMLMRARAGAASAPVGIGM